MDTLGHCAFPGKFIVSVACQPVCFWTSGGVNVRSNIGILTRKAKKMRLLWGVCLPSELWTILKAKLKRFIWLIAVFCKVFHSSPWKCERKKTQPPTDRTHWGLRLVLETHPAVLLTVLHHDLRDYISNTSVAYARLQWTVRPWTALMLPWTVHLLTSVRCTGRGSTPP